MGLQPAVGIPRPVAPLLGGDDFLAGAKWEPDEPVVWAAADRVDPPDPEIGDAPQLYNLDAVAYESIMLGFFEIHLGPDNDVLQKSGLPKITELNFAYSRDGFHWHRPDRTRGNSGRAARRVGPGLCAVAGQPLLRARRQLWFYYIGFQGDAEQAQRQLAAERHVRPRRDRRGVSAPRRVRLDGRRRGAGTLTTRPVRSPAGSCSSTPHAQQGELRVEILDEAGEPIEPFTLGELPADRADSTLEPVAWTGAEDLSALRGKPVRFRFTLRNGSLYAFWVSRDATGRSDGYVAGGGPGFTGMTDTVGRAALDAEQLLGVR